MRVNVDDVAFMDPRFKKLGQRLGVSWFEALGRCLPVWAMAYVGRSPIVTGDDVDAIAELPGFAEAMIHSGLASAHADGVWIRGVTDRIDFLLLQDAKRNRANQARRTAMGLTSDPPRGPSPGKSPGTSPEVAPGSPPGSPRGLPYSPALTLTLTHTLAQDAATCAADAPPKRRVRKSRTVFDCSAEEREAAVRVLGKLGERNGVAYEGCDEHVRTIVSRLRDGRSEMDLRKIIAFCAEVKKWETDPEWTHCLNPDTLFGPKNITRYLDPARSWAAKEYPEPKLEVVR